MGALAGFCSSHGATGCPEAIISGKISASRRTNIGQVDYSVPLLIFGLCVVSCQGDSLHECKTFPNHLVVQIILPRLLFLFLFFSWCLLNNYIKKLLRSVYNKTDNFFERLILSIVGWVEGIEAVKVKGNWQKLPHHAVVGDQGAEAGVHFVKALRTVKFLNLCNFHIPWKSPSLALKKKKRFLVYYQNGKVFKCF